MVDVRSRRCSHASCTKWPSFNLEGRKAGAYCNTHAEDGMVDVNGRRCLHDPCTRRASFNTEGTKMAAYRKTHARDSMVDVNSKRCSHDPCTKPAAWGLLTDSRATVCYRHKNLIASGSIFNLRARCRVEGCCKSSRWGLDGKQPTHCPDHGPFEHGLVCTVSTGRGKRYGSSPSYHAVRAPSFHVTTECWFGAPATSILRLFGVIIVSSLETFDCSG